MKLLLRREIFSENSTLGSLYVDGIFECYTLEDRVRAEKVWGKTAIPQGTYKVIITPSPRFKKLLPRLVDVPNFEGVLIHPGNTHLDTEGCILVGETRAKDFVGQSRRAFSNLFAKLRKASDITIEVRR